MRLVLSWRVLRRFLPRYLMSRFPKCQLVAHQSWLSIFLRRLLRQSRAAPLRPALGDLIAEQPPSLVVGSNGEPPTKVIEERGVPIRISRSIISGDGPAAIIQAI